MLPDLLYPEFLLRFGISLVMIVFGIHQLMQPRDWLEYLPAWLKKFDPLSPITTMRLHGVGNVVLGFWFFTNILPIIAGWVVFGWWLSILPFAFRKNWAIGMRDLTIIFAIAAYLSFIYLS